MIEGSPSENAESIATSGMGMRGAVCPQWSSGVARIMERLPAKFYIVQPALQRLAGRARPGALVVGRELAQVVP